MRKKLLFNLFLATTLGLTVTSCSNDSDNDVPSGKVESVAIKPAKASEISVYSGGIALNSASTKLMTTNEEVATVGAFTYTKYGTATDLPAAYRSSMPAKVTDEEKAYVKQYFIDHAKEAGVACYNIDYFIQYAGSSYDNYTGIVDHNGTKYKVTGSSQMDYIEINGNHINDYNANYGPDALCLNLPVNNPCYHDSWGNMDNVKYDAYKIFKITYNGKEAYYLGFDYKTKKDSGESFAGDGIYNDYIVKLTPADDKTHGGNTGGGSSTTTDSTNVGEVEVNLSVNAEKSVGDYIATKLSIHVRDTSDVEVFIPATAEYYCQADDMNIVLSHKAGVEKYNASNATTMSYEIDGQTVTLAVTYELGGIRVKTSGINATVLKYLRKTYGDGINFEVWNYYKSNVTISGTTTAITRGMIKNQFLDKSTVTFTANPGQYVNAFASINDYTGAVYEKADAAGVRTPYTDAACTQVLDASYWDRLSTDARYYVLHSTMNAWDCTVTPTDANYTLKGTKNYNKIYKK